MIHYIVASKDASVKSLIIIGGTTRKLAIEAFERYNSCPPHSSGKWKGKYGGERDFKIVRMNLTRVK